MDDELKPEEKLKDFFTRNEKMKHELLETFRLYPEKKSIVVDYQDLQKFGREGLYYCDRILNRPKAILADFEAVLHELAPAAIKDELVRGVTFRFRNLPRKVAIRQLRSADLNKYIAFDGVVRMVGQVKPKITTAVFRCQNCGEPVRVPQ